MRYRTTLFAILCAWFLPSSVSGEDVFQLVVMDPLSKPLSCDCVKGYAQRDYELLGDYLSNELGAKVNVTWHESLGEAMKETNGQFDLVIGKHSVVLHDAKEQNVKAKPVARLTGKDGSVSQQGLIVVRSGDSAKIVKDLGDYQLFIGPPEAEEKSSAPLALLKASGVKVSDATKTFSACSEAAAALLKLPSSRKAAAVISSYAEPLLQGCGSIKKGDLRIVARTPDVPFVTAFVNAEMSKKQRSKVQTALLNVGANSKLLVGLETSDGFVAWKRSKKKSNRGQATTVTP